ncbi:MAG: hypothetical protein WC809_01340 [Sinimarinibacterium sp.]|jgi:hypothetical protein
MAISAISGLVLVPPGRQQPLVRPDGEPVGPSAGQSAEALNKQLHDQREASVAWQLIKRTVGDAQAETADESADAPADVDTAPPPPTIAAESSAPPSALEIEYLGVEVHLSEVQIDADGVRITQADLTYERLVVRKSAEAPVQKSDPLALDLDGNGSITTTGVDRGQAFDLNADGVADRASVVAGGDAFLALDANGNGRIDDGRELFGDQNGAVNGFEALRTHDDNRDGVIDSADAVYQDLSLLDWQPDGTQRLRTLADAGVASISLAYADADRSLNAVDRMAQQGGYTRSDGSTALAADLLLGFRAVA